MVGGDGVGNDGASDNEVDDGGDGDGNSEGNDDDYQVITMIVLRWHGLRFRIIIIIHCDVGDGVVVGVEVEVVMVGIMEATLKVVVMVTSSKH